MSFRQQLTDYLQTNANPQHKYGHQPRLYALTQQIGASLPPSQTYDDDVVFAACFLHDLGVFIGHRPEDPAALITWNHVTYTCNRAPEILHQFGFPKDKIGAVLEVIRQHQAHDQPATLEAIITRDADILEQLGAIGITRTLAKLGSDTRFHTFTDARNSLQRALEILPTQIRLDATKQLAQPRIRIMQAFLQHLESESGNHLH